MDALTRAFLETAYTYGVDGIELEFRLPLVHRSLVERVTALLERTPAFRDLGTVETKEEYSGGDARRVTSADGTVRTLYKRRIDKAAIDGPVVGTVSLERWMDGEPPHDQSFPTYRKKTRRRFAHRCWEVHLTSFQTNDPRLSDQDGLLYDIELELDPASDELFVYTVDYMVQWGVSLLQQMTSST